MFINAVMYCPFFIYFYQQYQLSEILLANANMALVYVASIALSGALKAGKAGHVLAVENLKVVWQVLLTISI